MADLSLVTADKVNIGTLTILQHTLPAGADITAGAPVYIDSTTHKWLRTDANGSGTRQAWGVAPQTVKSGQSLTVVGCGFMDGWDLSGMADGAPVFASDTVGRLADATGTTSIFIGTVIPVWSANLGSINKVLFVSAAMSGQGAGGALTASITSLTNSSGGTADNTVAAVPDATAAVTDTSAASLTSVNASILVIKNDIADVTAKINEILAAL